MTREARWMLRTAAELTVLTVAFAAIFGTVARLETAAAIMSGALCACIGVAWLRGATEVTQ